MAEWKDLLPQVKRKLNITWSDELTDARVIDVMEEIGGLLRHKLGAGAAEDVWSAPDARMLFKEWCLYAWNHKTNEFAADYAGEIEACRARLMLVEESEDGES